MTAYRLSQPIAGVQFDQEADHPVMVRLMAGTMVTVTGEASGSGLVNIKANGQVVTVFLADLEERSEKVQAAP